jgi:hypothetical protein
MCADNLMMAFELHKEFNFRVMDCLVMTPCNKERGLTAYPTEDHSINPSRRGSLKSFT